jgi:uncharacterized OB-fold protein
VTYTKPLPEKSAAALPFWEAANQDTLKIQRCRSCNAAQFYPRDLCRECWSRELDWISCSGKATVYSYTICRLPPHPGFEEDLPLVIAIVELEEGVTMTTNIIGCDPEQVEIGMPVEAVFDHVDEDTTLVKFKPASSH